MLIVWLANGLLIALLMARAFNNSKDKLLKSFLYAIVISVVSGLAYNLLFASEELKVKDLIYKFDKDQIIYNAWLLGTFIITIWVFRWSGIR